MFICIQKRQILVALLVFVLLIIGAQVAGKMLQSIPAQAIYPCRLPSRTFVIDAGHGGPDGGASSASGVQEDEINLSISKKLDALLGFYGVNTKMTRTEDISLHDAGANTLREKKVSDLKNRVAFINATENVCLISIHQNSFPQQKYRGAQVFYRNDDTSKGLAEEIQSRVQLFLDPSNQRKAQRVSESIYLMHQINCPAVLVECGFLSNSTDEQLLQQDAYQQKIAATIAAACLRGA